MLVVVSSSGIRMTSRGLRLVDIVGIDHASLMDMAALCRVQLVSYPVQAHRTMYNITCQQPLTSVICRLHLGPILRNLENSVNYDI